MKDVSCVDSLLSKHVTNVPAVVANLPEVARLENFWKAWEDLGAGPKVIQIPRRVTPFPFGPNPNWQGHRPL